MSDIQERITKLLQKAESAGTSEEEALALTTKAAELAMRAGLDLALLKPEEYKRELPDYEDILLYNPFSVPKGNLLNGIGKSFGCTTFIHKSSAHNKNQNAAVMRVFGFKSDIRQVKVILASCIIQGTNGSERRRRLGHTSRGFHSSYWYGFAKGVADQLKQSSESIVKEVEAAHPGTALMLANRDSQIGTLVKSVYPRVTFVKRYVTNSNGYSNGYSDGSSAVIGGSRQVNGIKAIGN